MIGPLGGAISWGPPLPAPKLARGVRFGRGES
jgi:hypothetical protein